jgi:hypothetical protein
MRCGYPRQVTLVQSVARREFEKVGHRGAHEMRMRRFGITLAINVGLHDVARFINIVTIESGAMTLVFTYDLKAINRGAVSFATTGYAGPRGSIPSAVEIGFLRPQAHDDRRPARMTLRRFDVTMSVTMLQPLRIMRVAPSTKNCESRFMHSVSADYRAITPTLFRLNRSVSFTPFLRPLMTNVLFSPKVDHGPGGTSLKSTNRQSVTSVCFSSR